MRQYEKYEYCKSIQCPDLQSCAAIYFCDNTADYCRRTAKEFHHWLKENGFQIVKTHIQPAVQADDHGCALCGSPPCETDNCNFCPDCGRDLRTA